MGEWGRGVATRLNSRLSPLRTRVQISRCGQLESAACDLNLWCVLLPAARQVSPGLPGFPCYSQNTFCFSLSSFLSGVHGLCCRTRRPNIRIKKNNKKDRCLLQDLSALSI